jgi:hypothetical protein
MASREKNRNHGQVFKQMNDNLGGLLTTSLLRFRASREDWKLLGFSVLLNAILFGLFLIIFTPCYETNDDLVMQHIASGLYTGHPSEYLVFTSVVVGWTLKILYAFYSGCNWYLLYLLTLHFAALSALAFVVLSRWRHWVSVLLFIGFFVLAEARILLNLQFTTTAFLAGTAGVLLIVDGCRARNPVHFAKVVAGFTFIGIMMMVREPVAPFMGLVAAPFLIERLGRGGRRRMLVLGLGVLVLFAVLTGINRWYYQRDHAWADFVEYNKLRGRLHCTPLGQVIADAAPAVGWTRNDGSMFSNFYFSDPEIYGSVATMRRLSDEVRQVHRLQNSFPNLSIRNFILCKALGSDAGVLVNVTILSGAWCLFFAGPLRRDWFITLIALYLLCLALSFYFRATTRLPQRVSYNMPLFALSMCLYWAASIEDMGHPFQFFTHAVISPSRAFLFRGVVILAVFGSSVMCTRLASAIGQGLLFTNAANSHLRGMSHQIFDPVEKLLPRGQQPVLVSMPFEPINSRMEQCMLFWPPSKGPSFSLVPYGWLSHSPLFQEVLVRHRLVPYSLSLVDRPDVFFLMESRWIQPLRVFYREHYGMDIQFKTILCTNETQEYNKCDPYLYQAHVVSTEKDPFPLSPSTAKESAPDAAATPNCVATSFDVTNRSSSGIKD